MIPVRKVYSFKLTKPKRHKYQNFRVTGSESHHPVKPFHSHKSSFVVEQPLSFIAVAVSTNK
jgi:hypothetical protein